MNNLIGALDVGKTHTRLSIIDPEKSSEVWSARRVNRSIETLTGRQLDIAGIERWFIEALASAPHRDQIGTIVPIAHGAAAVLIGKNSEILTAPDYEDPRFEKVRNQYEAERDPFTSTYSPSMPLGLNLGRQLFYLKCNNASQAPYRILLYPQYWAWCLSGFMASEVTSLGCHTDLWLPEARTYSAMAVRHGWSALLPPLRSAGEVLGPAEGPLAHAAGLPPTCRVTCGIHDSNASYLRYLLGRRDQPFVVISSGTWTVFMANKTPLNRLRDTGDMSANVNAFGDPVATARFMGGREYARIAGGAQAPTLGGLKSLLEKRAMDGGGLTPPEKASLATLYIALMSDWMIEDLGCQGEIIVDGPLAANPLFGSLLAALRPSSPIFSDLEPSAISAICHLAGWPETTVASLEAARPLKLDSLERYRSAWRQLPRATGPS